MEEMIQEALSKGVKLHIAGEHDLASELYESVITLQPDHADANHNMGLLKLDMGFDLEALPYLQTALQADTTITQFWLSYIKALTKLVRLDEAARILNLAKESGIAGEQFMELDQMLNSAAENVRGVPGEVRTPKKSQPNILDNLNLNQALRLAEKKANEEITEEAKQLYKDILAKFPKNRAAQQGFAYLNRHQQTSSLGSPPQDLVNGLMNLYNNLELVLQ